MRFGVVYFYINNYTDAKNHKNLGIVPRDLINKSIP